jgi:hypothetical protein
MKATIKTRCGCWKHQDVTFPPPKIIVPLKAANGYADYTEA